MAEPDRVEFHVDADLGNPAPNPRVYTRLPGRGGTTWYVPTDERAADGILHSTSETSGFGGREFRLQLVDGSKARVIGPWLSNADHLHEETGVDLRARILFAYVIARQCEKHYFRATYDGILESCLDGMFGRFDYARERGQWWANHLGTRVEVGQRTNGGGSFGWADPDFAHDLGGEFGRIEIPGNVHFASLRPDRSWRVEPGAVILTLGPDYSRDSPTLRLPNDQATVLVDAMLAAGHRFAERLADDLARVRTQSRR